MKPILRSAQGDHLGQLFRPLRLLVLCTANVARSQMAEALAHYHGGSLVEVASAGATPGNEPHPLAVAVLAERGIDWCGRRSKGIDAVAGQPWDLVITVCDAARDACPVLPGATMVHWGLEDPAAAVGTELERRDAFRRTAAALDKRMAALFALPLESFTPDQLARAAAQIHAEA